MRGRRVSRDLCKKAMYVNPKVQDKRASLLRRTKTTNAPDFIHTHTTSKQRYAYICMYLLLLYNYRFFFLLFQLLATSTILQHFHIKITEQYFYLQLHTQIHSICMQFLLWGPSAICKQVLYTCVYVSLNVCVALSRRQFFSFIFGIYFQLHFHMLLHNDNF